MPTNDEILAALKSVIDPEIGMNIVDLGLVYDVDYDPDNSRVHVSMSLTSPGCTLGPQIIRDIRLELVRLKGVKKVDVDLVWSPPWDPKMMSDYAKEELGWDEEMGLSYTYY